MALRGMDATGRLRGDSHRYGLENWRELLLRSGLDFSAWRMSRRPHLFDVYDELYREEVVGEVVNGGRVSKRRCADPSESCLATRQLRSRRPSLARGGTRPATRCQL